MGRTGVEVILPRVDMDMTTGKRWLVAEGKRFRGKERGPVPKIESDKAAMEIEAPAAGVLGGGHGRPGDELPVGTVVGWIVAPGETFRRPDPRPRAGPVARDPEPTPSAWANDKPDAEAEVSASVKAHDERGERATPKARQLTGPRVAADRDCSSRQAAGSRPERRDRGSRKAQGPNLHQPWVRTRGAPARSRTQHRPRRAERDGRGGDHQGTLANHIHAGAPASDQPAARCPNSCGGLREIRPLWRRRAPALAHQADPAGRVCMHPGSNIPHVTHCDEADITELEGSGFRQALENKKAKSNKQPGGLSSSRCCLSW